MSSEVLNNNKTPAVNPNDSDDEFFNVVDDEVAGVAQDNLPQASASQAAPLDNKKVTPSPKQFNISAAYSPDQGIVTSKATFRTTIEISGQTFGIVLRKGLPLTNSGEPISRELAQKFFKVSLLDLESQGKLPKEGKSMSMLISDLSTRFQLMASNGQLIEEIERTSDRIVDLNTSYRKGDVAGLETALTRFENEVLNSSSKSVNFNAPPTIEHPQGEHTCPYAAAIQTVSGSPDFLARLKTAKERIKTEDPKKTAKHKALDCIDQLVKSTGHISGEQILNLRKLLAPVADTKTKNNKNDPNVSMLPDNNKQKDVNDVLVTMKNLVSENYKSGIILRTVHLDEKGVVQKEDPAENDPKGIPVLLPQNSKTPVSNFLSTEKTTLKFNTAPPELDFIFLGQSEKGKNTTPVQIDATYILPKENLDQGDNETYLPSSILIHIGKDNNGHIVAVRRTPDNRYYLCDDMEKTNELLPNPQVFLQKNASNICRVIYTKKSIIDEAIKAAQQPAQENNAAKAAEAKADAKAKELLPPAAPGTDQPKIATAAKAPTGPKDIQSKGANQKTKLIFKEYDKPQTVAASDTWDKNPKTNTYTIVLDKDFKSSLTQAKYNNHLEQAFKGLTTEELKLNNKIRFVINRDSNAKDKTIDTEEEEKFFNNLIVNAETWFRRIPKDDESAVTTNYAFNEIEVMIMPLAPAPAAPAQTAPKATKTLEGTVTMGYQSRWSGNLKYFVHAKVEEYPSKPNNIPSTAITLDDDPDVDDVTTTIAANSTNSNLTILVEGDLTAKDIFDKLDTVEYSTWWPSTGSLANLHIVIVPPSTESKED